MNFKNEEIIEYYKCAKDFIYFANNYIQDFTTPIPTQINLYVPQINIITALHNHHYVVLLGSRQVGKTILIEMYICWLILFHAGYNVSILSKKAEATCKIIYEIKRLLENLKAPFTVNFENKQQVEKCLESKLRLINKSEIQAITVPKQNPEEAGRGSRAGFIFVDEAAHIPELPKIMSGLMHTTNRTFLRYKKHKLPHGIIIASTPNGTTGTGKYFYDLWKHANLNQNGFYPIRFHWSQVSEFTQAWYNEQCKKHPQRDIDQELDLKFLPPENSFLNETIISKLQNNMQTSYEKIYIENLEMHVYEKNNENNYYIIGIDVATEHGPEFTAINVLCYQTQETVLEYIGKCSVSTLCKCIDILIKYYNISCIIAEANGLGNQVIEYCLKKEELRKRLFYTVKKKETKYGLISDHQTRNQILSNIYMIVNEQPEKIQSERLKLQLISLRNKHGRIEGDPDDLVFAYGLTLYAAISTPQITLNIFKRINKNIENNVDILHIKNLYNQRYETNNIDEELELSNNIKTPFFKDNSTQDFDIFIKTFFNQE